MTHLALAEVSKRFGAVKAVDCLSFDVNRGEIFTLLGPSGCGKTTTLRLIAGLEEPESGDISFQEEPIVSVSRGIFTPPHKRKLGMVFQSYALWPNMTVYENVFYPLRLRRISSHAAREKVLRALELVGLCGLEDRPAPLLSGGQQQRVALARALVYEPSLLLLDEPFSNLDAKLREQMRIEVKLLQKKLGVTTVFVTHDQVEALSLSDRIALMNNGRIEQLGSPSLLYQSPLTPFARDFLGKTVILYGQVSGRREASIIEVEVDGLPQRVLGVSYDSKLGPPEKVCLAIRPEDIVVNFTGYPPVGENWFRGIIEALLFVGDRYQVSLLLENGDRVLCYAAGRETLREGEAVHIRLPHDLISVWQL
ncbi:MAG: ABC transporter ATP-binding protein [Deltaproteobacteria bacterium]|nr:ABC transporter ATP-binding protein [Deltaproteobacteria bacterium]